MNFRNSRFAWNASENVSENLTPYIAGFDVSIETAEIARQAVEHMELLEVVYKKHNFTPGDALEDALSAIEDAAEEIFPSSPLYKFQVMSLASDYYAARNGEISRLELITLVSDRIREIRRYAMGLSV